jgi:hypothetical protein
VNYSILSTMVYVLCMNTAYIRERALYCVYCMNTAYTRERVLCVLHVYCLHQEVCILCVLQYSKDHALPCTSERKLCVLQYGILRAMSCVHSMNT